MEETNHKVTDIETEEIGHPLAGVQGALENYEENSRQIFADLATDLSFLINVT